MKKGLRKTGPQDWKPTRRESGPSLEEKPEPGLCWLLETDDRALWFLPALWVKMGSGWMWWWVCALMLEEKDPTAGHKGRQVLANISNIAIPLLYPVDPHPCPVTASHGGGPTLILVFLTSQDVLGRKLGLFLCDLGGFEKIRSPLSGKWLTLQDEAVVCSKVGNRKPQEGPHTGGKAPLHLWVLQVNLSHVNLRLEGSPATSSNVFRALCSCLNLEHRVFFLSFF